MNTKISHFAGPKISQSLLEDRFCRPGAQYGPRSVEYGMGVRKVYHERATVRSGTIRCPDCKLSFDQESDA